MKILRLSCLIFAAAAAGTVMAEPPAPPAGEPGPAAKKDKRPQDERPMAGLFKRADTDGDGFLSLAEFSALDRIAKLPDERRAEIFKRFDKNGDGKVSAEEMRPMQRGGMPPMEQMDLDKDGRITFEEFQKSPFIARLPEDRRHAMFDRMDTDKDGALTPKDRPPRRPPGPGEGGRGEGRRGRGNPLDLIRDLDKNGDGALSFEEFRQAPFLKDRDEDFQEDRFEEFDKNHDLKIDATDFPPPEERRPEGPPPEAPPLPPADGGAKPDAAPKR